LSFSDYTTRAITALRMVFRGPHGFNIGMNLGTVAGAGGSRPTCTSTVGAALGRRH